MDSLQGDNGIPERESHSSPIISVIVPVYRVSPYLSRCIESILAQSFRAYELILVDDESPDRCPEICDAFAERDPGIHVLHIRHGGLSAARNAGIDYVMEESDSRYITFIDGDDWVHPHYLRWLYEAVSNRNVALAVGNYTKVTGDCAFTESGAADIITPEMLYREDFVSFIVAWGKLFSKDDFKDLRFPEGKLHEDTFVIWRIMFKQQSIAYIDAPIYAYLQRSDSITGVWTPDRLVRLNAMNEMHTWIENNGSRETRIASGRMLAKVYAGELTEMTAYGMPMETIRQYRKELRKHIGSIREHFPVHSNTETYKMAWPIEMRVRQRIYPFMRRIKRVLLRVISG